MPIRDISLKDLAETLKAEGVCLITKVRKNMTPEPLSDFDALMLKKRMLIETVIDQLKPPMPSSTYPVIGVWSTFKSMRCLR